MMPTKIGFFQQSSIERDDKYASSAQLAFNHCAAERFDDAA
jgi:hypothetical protein